MRPIYKFKTIIEKYLFNAIVITIIIVLFFIKITIPIVIIPLLILLFIVTYHYKISKIKFRGYEIRFNGNDLKTIDVTMTTPNSFKDSEDVLYWNIIGN
jgi:hypothetical protein